MGPPLHSRCGQPRILHLGATQVVINNLDALIMEPVARGHLEDMAAAVPHVLADIEAMYKARFARRGCSGTAAAATAAPSAAAVRPTLFASADASTGVLLTAQVSGVCSRLALLCAGHEFCAQLS
jgi:hypothetical protein